MSDAEKWDARWKKTGEPGAPSAFFVRRFPLLLRRLRRTPGARVLDLACGLGRHALPLARAGISVDALDVSEVALRRLGRTAAREVLPLRTIRSDLSDAAAAAGAMGTNRYDAILVFFYLERPLFTPLARAAKPGGLLLFETRVASGPPGSAANAKGFWLAPGELGALLQPQWRIIELQEQTWGSERLARAMARRR